MSEPQNTSNSTEPQMPAGGGAPVDPGLSRLLTTIFQDWAKAGIVFLILRNYQELPAATTNDVDVLLDRDQLNRGEEVMIAAAGTCGYLLHNRVEFATISYFFHHPESLRQIQIDLFTETKWHTLSLLPTKDVLSRRKQGPLFSTPSPADEAIISLLSRLVYQGQVREKYKAQILSAFRDEPSLATTLLSVPFGSSLGTELVRLSLEQNWRAVESLKGRLRFNLLSRALTHRPWQTCLSAGKDFMRLLRRLFHPGGLVIVVLGPDGCGKSTVSAEVVRQLQNTFNPAKMRQIHWKPVVFLRNRRKGSGTPNVAPHGQEPRGSIASLAYLIFHWLEFMIGSQLLFRRTTFKNGLVLVDRYFYDFFVDQRRFRLRTSETVVRMLFTAVKRPDLTFLLDAPAEVLQARKAEVPFEETQRQVGAYRKVIAQLPHSKTVDATVAVESAADTITSTILRFLHERTIARRHGVKSNP